MNVLATPNFTVKALAEAGAKRISLGSKLTTAAFGSLQAASREMLDKGGFEFSKQGVGFGDLQALFLKRDKN